MSGVKLSVIRSRDLNEQITALVSKGDVKAVENAPDAVLVECARRYVAAQIQVKQRGKSRAREHFAVVRDEANARLARQAKSLVLAVAAEIHPEWAAELLAAEFALPDGTRVTWALATALQHEERAAQLEGLAAGTMQTAAIHRRAIHDIEQAGVTSLAEVPR